MKKTKNSDNKKDASNTTQLKGGSNQVQNREVSNKNSNNNNNNKNNNNNIKDKDNFCRIFRFTGNCKYGDQCKYLHDNNLNKKYNEKNQRKNMDNTINYKAPVLIQNNDKSSPLNIFLEQIKSKLNLNNNKMYFLPSIENLELWITSFEYVAAGSCIEYGYYLLKAYLDITDSSTYAPKSINVLEILTNILKIKPSNDSLIMVRDIISLRLKRTSATATITNKENLIKTLNQLKSQTEKCIADLFLKPKEIIFADILKLGSELQELMNTYASLVSNLKLENILDITKDQSNDNEMNHNLFEWYKHPTIEWLSSGNLLLGPKMKSHYESIDEYVFVIQSVWTMLSFYWGIATFWPKCNCRSAGDNISEAQVCGVPLLTHVTNCNTFCRMQIQNAHGTGSRMCGNVASWRCYRPDHETICESCLTQKKKKILNSSKSWEASTDIYDGCVYQSNTLIDGFVVHVNSLLSRKPPRVEINWKTSYRLQPSALVGLVLLPAYGLPLKPDMRIYWGEVIDSHNKDNPEHMKRQRGQISIRLLSHSDCSLLPSNMEIPFNVGSRIAIIDLRVFTPEVISVLATLVQHSFVEGFNRLSFTRPLLGFGQDTNILSMNFTGSIQEMTTAAIMNSNITFIKQLSVEYKEEAIKKILSYKVILSLDNTQSQAFASGLYYALHCTQGPPGTGKSYVGVCLVLAFVEIRKILMKSTGRRVGPIVTLSYKNHALDEFLVDLVSNGIKQPRDLIRIGTTESSILKEFTEKSSLQESEAKKELERRVNVMKEVKHVYLRWYSVLNDGSTSLSSNVVLECISIIEYILSEMLKLHPLNKTDISEQDPIPLDGLLPATSFEILTSLRDKLATTSDIHLQFPSLQQDAEHWVDTGRVFQRSLFLIERWVSGQVPPPRCEALITIRDKDKLVTHQCLQCAEENNIYCKSIHSCNVSSCYNLCVENGKYCMEHYCQYDGLNTICENKRIVDSLYCVKHCCPNCIVNSKVGNNEACIDHTCFYCNKSQLPSLTFCLNHCCKICASKDAIASKSICCIDGNQIFDLCELHKCNLRHCSNMKSNNNEFCEQHTCKYCPSVINITVDLECDVCFQHRCAYFDDQEYCNKAKVINALSGNISLFCEIHTCRGCAFKGNSLDQIVSNSNYMCSYHSMCQFVNDNGEDCNALAHKNNGVYCALHEVVINNTGSSSCNGIAKKTNKRCRAARPPNIHSSVLWYCASHLDQAKKDIIPEIAADIIPDINILYRPLPIYLENHSIEFITNRIHSDKHSLKHCKENNCPYFCSNKTEVICNLHKSIHKTSMIELEKSRSASLTIRKEPEVAVNTIPVINVQMPLESTKLLTIKKDDVIQEEGEVKNISTKSSTETVQFVKIESEYVDDQIYNMNPDELEQLFEYDDVINEQQQHQQEIFKEESDDDEDINNQDDPTELIIDEWLQSKSIYTSKDILICLNMSKEWNWSMDNLMREKELYTVISIACLLLKKLSITAEKYIDDARRRKAEANGALLKSTVVIGATVVGAAKRLMALRAAEPLVILVEEACEVIEPTLIAVLAVESVQKLEMIGDHRQLPAFVNNCWFNIECTMPSLKVSLFERLVMTNGKASSNRICAVLDVQRRMRQSISNLTRHEYADIVNIIDHESTFKQRIGDRMIAAKSEGYQRLLQYRSSWVSNGRSIPGMQSCIYFWNLENNIQSKPIAGLSACNKNEADAVANLVKYLALCGVPLSSISIITPYQGQKRLIFQELRRLNVLPKYNMRQQGNSFDEQSTVQVSTVDRYQGDENDIIIFSLVRTKPGNRFVSLLNRFIVSTSRARLGFYIIGSTDALGSFNNVKSSGNGTRHWSQLIEHLSKPDECGCDDSFHLPRIGKDLSICCPQHLQSTSLVSSVMDKRRIFPSNESWSSFCSVTCINVLKCGHNCNLPCHAFDVDKHAEKCNELIERPCNLHSEIPIICHTLNKKLGEHYEQTLKRWKCEELVKVVSPCQHVTQIKCYLVNDMQLGNIPYPRCDEIVEEYIFPQCNHIIKSPKCYQWHDYQINIPKCKTNVHWKKPCNHMIQLECWKMSEEKNSPSKCKMPVSGNRPRCLHKLSLQCCDYEELHNQWTRFGGNSVEYISNAGTIAEVKMCQTYGPTESEICPNLSLLKCEVPTNVKLECGHTIEMNCNKAFECVNNKSNKVLCNTLVKIPCCICCNDISVPCHTVEAIQLLITPKLVRDVLFKDPRVLESTINTMIVTDVDVWKVVKLAKCNGNIDLIRNCDPLHVETLKCETLVKYILNEYKFKKCTKLATRILSCDHTVKVKCFERDFLPEPICLAPTSEVYQFKDCNHCLQPNNCDSLQALIKNIDLKCTAKVTSEIYRCKHSINVFCSISKSISSPSPGLRLQDNIVIEEEVYCLPCEDPIQCTSNVDFKRYCGHIDQNIPCELAFSWNTYEKSPSHCDKDIQIISPLCKHEVNAKCFEVGTINEWKPWDNDNPIFTSFGTVDNEIDSQLSNIAIKFPIPKPQSLLPNNIILSCNKKVYILFDRCDHSKLVDCKVIFDSSRNHRTGTLECEELVDIICPGPCQTKRFITCSRGLNSSLEEISNICNQKMEKICMICQINSVNTLCCTKQIQCQSMVEVVLQCGHKAKWQCGIDQDPRIGDNPQVDYNTNCYLCAKSHWDLDRELELNEDLLRNTALDMLKETLKENAPVICESISIVIDFEQYDKTRDNIISLFLNAMETKKIETMFPPYSILTDNSLDAYIRANYDLVYLEVPSDKSPNPNEVKKRFNIGDTKYGKGKQVYVLEKTRINDLCSGTGEVKLCLALAFRINSLKDKKPFSIGNGGKAMQQQANKSRNEYTADGYDSVYVLKEFLDKTCEIVYWHGAAIVPLAIVKLQLNESCRICGYNFCKDGEYGALCKQGHLVCYENCFPSYIDAASQPGSIKSYINSQGNLCCPECNKGYDIIQLVANKCPENICKSLLTLQSNYQLNESNEIVRREERKKYEDEIKRIQGMDELDREVTMLQKIIIEDILTPKCPRCSRAFIDFDGCFALTCGNCNAEFCAWCFEDCDGDDPHRHVANCTYNTVGSVYGDIKRDLIPVWNQIRQKKILDLVKTKTLIVKEKLFKGIKKDLADIGLGNLTFK